MLPSCPGKWNKPTLFRTINCQPRERVTRFDLRLNSLTKTGNSLFFTSLSVTSKPPHYKKHESKMCFIRKRDLHPTKIESVLLFHRVLYHFD